MAQTTEYHVRLVYALDDKASNALGALGARAGAAEKSVTSLADGFKTLAGILAAREIFGAGKTMLIDYNNQMQQLKISLGTVIQMDLGLSFDESRQKAGLLFNELQQFAKKTPLTTKEIGEFATNLSAAVLTAGGSVRDLANISEQGAIASQVLLGKGEGNMRYSSIELTEAIMGSVRKNQRFNKLLLSSTLDKHGLEFESFNKLGVNDRMDLIKEALSDPALKKGADEIEKSFAGVESTFRDTLEILAGSAGLPLFQAVTTEIKSWNDWLNKNEALVSEWGRTLGTALVDGFKMVKDAVSFIIDNKDTILLLGKFWLASTAMNAFGSSFGGLSGSGGKGLGGLASNLGVLASGNSWSVLGAHHSAMLKGAPSLGQVAGGAMMGATIAQFVSNADKANTTLMAMEGAFATLPGPIGLVAAGLLGFHAVLAKVADIIDKAHKEQVDLDSERQHLVDYITILNPTMKDFMGLAAHMREMGVMDKTIDPSGMMHGYINEGKFANWANGTKLSEGEKNTLFLMAKDAASKWQSDSKYKLDPLAGNRKTKDAAKVNVNIGKIEVASDDPDRFVIGMVRSFEKIVENPSGAHGAWSRGF